MRKVSKRENKVLNQIEKSLDKTIKNLDKLLMGGGGVYDDVVWTRACELRSKLFEVWMEFESIQAD